MTVNELHALLATIISAGHGDAEVFIAEADAEYYLYPTAVAVDHAGDVVLDASPVNDDQGDE